jgi:hypothetical protein
MPRVRVLCRLKGSADTVGFDMGLVSRVRPRGVSPPPGHLRCRSRRYVLRVGLVKKTSEGSFVPRRLARPDRREVGRSELRKLPQYEQSEEFKANTAQFRSGYQQIYGTPDAAGEQKITEAARPAGTATSGCSSFAINPSTRLRASSSAMSTASWRISASLRQASPRRLPLTARRPRRLHRHLRQLEALRVSNEARIAAALAGGVITHAQAEALRRIRVAVQ